VYPNLIPAGLKTDGPVQCIAWLSGFSGIPECLMKNMSMKARRTFPDKGEDFWLFYLRKIRATVSS